MVFALIGMDETWVIFNLVFGVFVFVIGAHCLYRGCLRNVGSNFGTSAPLWQFFLFLIWLGNLGWTITLVVFVLHGFVEFWMILNIAFGTFVFVIGARLVYGGCLTKPLIRSTP